MSLNASELQAAGSALGNIDPNTVGNRADVELQWAMKAYHHAETYDNLIKSVDPKFLKLTKMDDEIYTTFRQTFPDMKVDVLDVDEMKSVDGKKKWRDYCSLFENKVEHYNMGTLIRVNCENEFSEQNSTLVVRIQFLALEIARNREGFNSKLKQNIEEKASTS